MVASPPRRKNRDLIRTFDLVNASYFGGMVCGGIGWRKLPIKSAHCSLALCHMQERFIKVSHVMSDARIPDWYFNFVIFHEMLHLHVGQPVNPDGTLADPHSGRFQSIELQHPDYGRSVVFEETKLPKVINAWVRFLSRKK